MNFRFCYNNFWKGGRFLNTLERLNAVVDYVEKHITEKLDLNHLAVIACCSLYDFQRMFGFIAEMTIVEYIRKRRLTLAGLELRHSNTKVIDAALKYGYESPVSFARAFQAFHGVTPSEAKKSNVTLKIFPRIIFQIIVKEVPQMIRTDKITVDGKEYEASYFGEQDMTSTNEFRL
jgi:AraC family transcriptional regulator